jgi:hypothetical protein
MSLPWFKNMVGMTLSDEELKTIPNPTTEVIIHVTTKDIQAFGILGTLIIGPLSAIARKPTRNWINIRRRSTRCGLMGLALGCVAGPLMTYARIHNATEEAIYDRCYRLRCNRKQVRVDQASVVGLVAGGATSIVLGGCPMYGSLLGMSLGVLGMAVYNNSPK